MKNKALIIVLIVGLSIITISSIVFFTNVIFNRLHISIGTKESGKLVLDKNYKNKFDEINIKSKAGKIEIKSGDDEIRVVIHGDKDKTKVKEDDKSLNIESSTKACKGICFNHKVAKIEVYVPSDYAKKINIESNFGDIKVGNFKKADLIAKLDAGDIKVENIKNAKIKNHFGDVRINNSKKLDVKEDAGDVRIGIVKNIKVINKFGDIRIKEVNEYLDLNEKAGDIRIEKVNLTKSSKINNSLGDIKIESTNDIYINAKVDVGSTKVNKSNRKSDIELTITCKAGEIKVN